MQAGSPYTEPGNDAPQEQSPPASGDARLLRAAGALAALAAVVVALVLLTNRYMSAQRPADASSSGQGASQAATSQVLPSGAISGDEQAALTSAARTLAGQLERLGEISRQTGALKESLSRKADAGSSAVQAWDAEWEKRQNEYERRRDEVRAHNAAENAKTQDSATYVAQPDGSEKRVLTYKPDLWPAPERPGRPARLGLDITAEQQQCDRLFDSARALRSDAAAASRGSTGFGDSYRELTEALDSEQVALARMRSLMATPLTILYVGSVIDQSQLEAVDTSGPADLTAAAEVDFRAAASRYGISLADAPGS